MLLDVGHSATVLFYSLCLEGLARLRCVGGLILLLVWIGLDGRVLQGRFRCACLCVESGACVEQKRQRTQLMQALGGKGAGKLFAITENPISGLCEFTAFGSREN